MMRLLNVKDLERVGDYQPKNELNKLYNNKKKIGGFKDGLS